MKKVKNNRAYVSCIVAAGGSGTRMHADRNKLLLEINEIPVIAHTLMALQESEYIDEIIVSAREEDILYISDIASVFGISKLKSIIKGGKTRSESVKNAIEEVCESADLIAVHDGARPLVSNDSIKNVVLDALEFGASALGVKPKATLKRETADGFIKETVDRNEIYEIQTPQVFSKDIVISAYSVNESILESATDDCSLVESMGVKIKITNGEYTNIKVTTPEDIAICEAILQLKER